MSSAYESSPPNYTAPSAVDEISSQISTALAVQERLFNVREQLKRVKTGHLSELAPRVEDTDKRYVKLLNESRTSANELGNAIQNFLTVAIPTSMNTGHSPERRAAIVKEFANEIAASAHKDLQPYDKRVLELKNTLEQLVVDLTTIQDTIKNKPDLTNNGQPSSTTVATSRTRPQVYQRYLDAIFITKFLASVIGWSVAPQADSNGTDQRIPSKTAKSSSAAVDEAVLNDISALFALFSGLVGKLGHFGTVWEKLVADSAELSTYLSQGISDQDVIGNRVQAEVGVYEKIKQALDDYSIRAK